MKPRYFLRRTIAYLCDLLIVSMVFAIIAVALNALFDFKIIAPEMLRSHQCQEQQIISPERISQLLPVTGDQKHQQLFCRVTNMFISTYHLVILRRTGNADSHFSVVNLSYPADEAGNPINALPSEPFLVLLAPLIFALLVTRRGQTFGKQALDLVIFDKKLAKPKLSTALMREYLKALPIILSIVPSFYAMYTHLNLDIDAAALALAEVTAVSSGTLWFWFILMTVFSVAAFWYLFGSFIRWRGQSFWDQWTNLLVDTNDNLDAKIRDQ